MEKGVFLKAFIHLSLVVEINKVNGIKETFGSFLLLVAGVEKTTLNIKTTLYRDGKKTGPEYNHNPLRLKRRGKKKQDYFHKVFLPPCNKPRSQA